MLADSTVTNRIGEELDTLSEMDEEGEPFDFPFLNSRIGSLVYLYSGRFSLFLYASFVRVFDWVSG